MANAAMHGEEYVIASSLFGSKYALPVGAREEGIRSIICMPLESEDHRLGVILFYRGDDDRVDVEQIELIRTFARLAAHAIRNASAYARTVDMAQTDGLTGLYNRRKFEQRLHEEVTRAVRTQKPVAVVMFDLDHFKRINDVHGHGAGDLVLLAVARVLQRAVRDIDLAARIGGEEFLLLLPETDAEAALRAAERVREAIAAEAIALANGEVLHVTTSAGVAVYPRHATSEFQFVERADRALYVAKRQGRNRSIVYPA
jgi:diguanylate cyclase (GGDEF)-like protein